MSKKLLILGVNGFIGSNLIERILSSKDWLLYGMDLRSDKISDYLNNPRFYFFTGDIRFNKEWIEHYIQECDIVLPLIAIAIPAMYIQKPIEVFELDFESNLEVIRLCIKYSKRVIFPSTSEVYGMAEDREFNEEYTNFILGPINKQRWIYSCSKQLLDRVIYAYGEKDDLDYTIFRPFNWFGPKLDYIKNSNSSSSRVVTKFINNIIYDNKILLVNGGIQSRSFTYIDDGIDALIKIIENKNNCAVKQIFNIGNPNNNITIKELAYLIMNVLKKYDVYKTKIESLIIEEISREEYLGKSYQDIEYRVPSILKAINILEWNPKISIKTGLKRTLNYYIQNNII